MAETKVTKPTRDVSLSKAYLDLAKAKRTKDLPAIAAAEETIRNLKSTG